MAQANPIVGRNAVQAGNHLAEPYECPEPEAGRVGQLSQGWGSSPSRRVGCPPPRRPRVSKEASPRNASRNALETVVR
jgi:hypothetical protein